jgi:flavin-binding protein dodecin
VIHLPIDDRIGHLIKENIMSDSLYKVIELVGTSTKSWEDAAQHAVETAAKSLDDLRIAEVSKLDMKVENGKVVAYRARVHLSFKYVGA